MKKFLGAALFAAMCVGVTLTGCSDDDDKEVEEELTNAFFFGDSAIDIKVATFNYDIDPRENASGKTYEHRICLGSAGLEAAPDYLKGTGSAVHLMIVTASEELTAGTYNFSENEIHAPFEMEAFIPMGVTAVYDKYIRFSGGEMYYFKSGSAKIEKEGDDYIVSFGGKAGVDEGFDGTTIDVTGYYKGKLTPVAQD